MGRGQVGKVPYKGGEHYVEKYGETNIIISQIRNFFLYFFLFFICFIDFHDYRQDKLEYNCT